MPVLLTLPSTLRAVGRSRRASCMVATVGCTSWAEPPSPHLWGRAPPGEGSITPEHRAHAPPGNRQARFRACRAPGKGGRPAAASLSSSSSSPSPPPSAVQARTDPSELAAPRGTRGSQPPCRHVASLLRCGFRSEALGGRRPAPSPRSRGRAGLPMSPRACQFQPLPSLWEPGRERAQGSSCPLHWRAGCAGRGPRAAHQTLQPCPGPALQTRTTPGSHTSCHAHPTLALAEGSAGPDTKKGWQQWAQWAPPRRTLAESGGLQAPHGGRPGEGGSAGRPCHAPLLPEATRVPLRTVLTSQSPRGARTASTTTLAPSCPRRHGPHNVQPLATAP